MRTTTPATATSGTVVAWWWRALGVEVSSPEHDVRVGADVRVAHYWAFGPGHPRRERISRFCVIDHTSARTIAPSIISTDSSCNTPATKIW